MTISYVDQDVNLIESKYKKYKNASGAPFEVTLKSVDTVSLVDNCDGFDFVALP